MTRFVIILITAMVITANIIETSCYVRKACLIMTSDSNLCRYGA